MCSVHYNGTSEYRINGTVTSYAEYCKILEGEAILIKARNFLVFQGDVEAIAGKTPKELTKLIEQICGSDQLVPEYEQLKNEMEATAEASTFAFTKKRGITSELKMIQEQKEQVEKYEALQKKRSDLMVDWMLTRLFTIEQACEQQAAMIELEKGSLDKETADIISKKENEMKEAKKKLSRTQKELVEAEKAAKIAQREVDSDVPEAIRLEEGLRYAQQKLATLQTNEETLILENGRLEDSKKRLELEKSELEVAFNTFQMNAQEQLAASASIGPELLEQYHQLKDLAKSQSVKEILKKENLDRKIAPDYAKKRELEGKKFELDVRKEQLESQMGPLLENHKDLSQAHERVQVELREKRRELELVKANRRKLEQNEVELTAKLKACLNKLLQVKVDRSEGEKEVRLRSTVESLRRLFPGVHGRLAELCSPIGRQYETALGFILGRHMDSIVVDTEKTAIEAISFLREQRAGQATFIPLDTIQVKPTDDIYRTRFPGVRPAIDCVQYASFRTVILLTTY